VVARTDARQPLGLDEAIRRGRLYREAGADVVFVEAPESREELRALGFGMVVYPLTGLFASARAIERAFAALAVGGKAPEDPSAQMGFDEFTALVGLPERSATAERFRS
jgi:methylisocitrate lyase